MISKCLQKPQTLKNFLILITQTLNIPKNERKWNLFSWLMQLILSTALIHPAVQLPSVMTSKYMTVCHLSLHSLTAVTLLTANSTICSFKKCHPLPSPILFVQNLNPYNLLLVLMKTCSALSLHILSHIKFRTYYPASNPYILSITTVTLPILYIWHNEIWLLFHTSHCHVTLQIPLGNKTKKCYANGQKLWILMLFTWVFFPRLLTLHVHLQARCTMTALLCELHKTKLYLT